MSRYFIRTLGEADLPDPATLLAALPAGCRPALLDSPAGGWSYLGWSPDAEVARSVEPGAAPAAGAGPAGRWPLAASDPARDLERRFGEEEWAREDPRVAVAGGWLGYCSFESGHAWEPFPWTAPDPAGLPDLAFARYRRGVAWAPDGRAHWLWAEPRDASPADVRRERAEVEEEFRRLAAAAAPAEAGACAAAPQPTIAAAEYRRRVRRLREWIGEGELFQANLSHRLEGPAPGSARALYARLRAAQPTDRGAYWEDRRGRALLSASPELFLSIDGGVLETRPIKGTAARGRDAAADRRAAEALERSEKEVAELTMIVDMARHDLGRLAPPGGVEVLSAGRVEAYSTLFHRTARIRARWGPERGLAGLLRATFPPASVTGAPKVRALQAIAELEGEARGPYCGCFGFWEPGGPRGAFSVLIRTAVVAEGRLSLRVGAGIVWDSDPQREWEETLLKAQYLLRALDAGAVAH